MGDDSGMTAALPNVRAVLFDVFGTVVDWRSGVIRGLSAFGANRGLVADWPLIADQWRAEYQPSMEAVRRGDRPWTPLDDLHRESLERVANGNGIVDLTSSETDELVHAWHRLDPWPDVVDGLVRLRSTHQIGTLSNGNTTLLADLAQHGALPWDHLLGAETARAYKPLPAAYLRNVAAIGLEPAQVMLAAAHNSDLHAAVALGLRTAFIVRPTEHGPGQTIDRAPTAQWDVVTDTVDGLAEALG